MATYTESDTNCVPNQSKYPVTVHTMEKLYSLTDKSRTRLPDSFDPFSQICSRSFEKLELNEKSEQCEYPIYFCTEKSTLSLEAIIAYCSCSRKKLDRAFTLSSYFTLMMNLCQHPSSELFMEEINSSLSLQNTVAELKSFTDAKSLILAMVTDNFVENVSETLSRHRKILNSEYEKLLCMVGYLLLVPFDKYDELDIRNVLKPFADAMGLNAHQFGDSDLERSFKVNQIVKKTFEDEFGFRKSIFKHMVSLATRDDQLGIISRLAVKKLRFIKIEKVFLIEKYVMPCLPSILGYYTLEHPLYRSAFIRMDLSLNKFDSCERPFIWFLEEYLDDFTYRGSDLFVAYALAIRSYKEPDSTLPQEGEVDWFSENVHAFYDMRKDDVFEYLRRFEDLQRN